MSSRSRQVCFSPDVHDMEPRIFLNQAGGKGGSRVGGSRKVTGIWNPSMPNDAKSISTVKFLLQLGVKVVKAITFVSKSRSSRKVSSATLMTSRSFSDPMDSHRTEAVEDCIEFLHSSSTRERET